MIPTTKVILSYRDIIILLILMNKLKDVDIPELSQFNTSEFELDGLYKTLQYAYGLEDCVSILNSLNKEE